MKSLSLTWLCTVLSCYAALSQTIEPQVINSSGGTYRKPYYIIDWSVGELALIDLMQAPQGAALLTNGFIQPFTQNPNDINTDDQFGPDEIRILPNPTHDVVEINFMTKQQGRIKMILTDDRGRLMYNKEFSIYGFGHIERIDLRNAASGPYMLKINLLPSSGFIKKKGVYKIIKIN